jgi:hypothetical protein
MREVVSMAEKDVGLAQVLQRREAAMREWKSLSSRSTKDEQAALDRVRELGKLADDLAEQEARGREEEQLRRVVEIEATLAEAEAAVRELGERLVGERRFLHLWTVSRSRLQAYQWLPLHCQ